MVSDDESDKVCEDEPPGAPDPPHHQIHKKEKMLQM